MTVLGDYETGYIVTPAPPQLTVLAKVAAGAPRRRPAEPNAPGVSRLAVEFRATVATLTVGESERLALVALR